LIVFFHDVTILTTFASNIDPMNCTPLYLYLLWQTLSVSTSNNSRYFKVAKMHVFSDVAIMISAISYSCIASASDVFTCMTYPISHRSSLPHSFQERPPPSATVGNNATQETINMSPKNHNCCTLNPVKSIHENNH